MHKHSLHTYFFHTNYQGNNEARRETNLWKQKLPKSDHKMCIEQALLNTTGYSIHCVAGPIYFYNDRLYWPLIKKNYRACKVGGVGGLVNLLFHFCWSKILCPRDEQRNRIVPWLEWRKLMEKSVMCWCHAKTFFLGPWLSIFRQCLNPNL